jgi:anti-sigma B factor antagonist
VGDATVVTCRGRIIAGKEATALQHALDTLGSRSRHLVLHLGDVEFIDSCGLGLLVRYLVRAKHSSHTLTVCAVSPKIDEVLRVTKLRTVFPPYETEAAAITEAHRTDAASEVNAGATTVLCVDVSADVSTYLRELLKAAGYRVLSAHNLPDALILLVASKPAVVVLSAELHALRGTRTAEEFHRLAAMRSVVALPHGFSSHDAGDASQDVLRAVGSHARRLTES